MEKFSGVVKLGDLNDFIAPSQACVVGIGNPKKDTSESGEVSFKKVKQLKDAEKDILKPVKVSLHDCLACSGCVTSAETVLLEQQSIEEFLLQLQNKDKVVVVSLSPQSRTAMATYFEITPLQAFKKITGFLKSLGVHAVFDTSASRDLSLVEACEEFVAKFKLKNESNKSSLPILASACPGWICYAEKSHGKYILPHISSTKSPQQIMGSLIKRFFANKMGINPENVYHVTIMPCYDKKLEASRKDFVFELQSDNRNSTKSLTEVDCVLTSGELYDLLNKQNVEFEKLEEASLDLLISNVDEKGHLFGVRGGSGGFAESIFKYAAETLFGKVLEGPLNFRTLRNPDFTEISLEIDGKKVLNFACCYGFRNIQNLVRKVKAGRSEYHFVEIMACPSGCLNGGGQLKAPEGKSQKKFLEEMESTYLQEVDVSNPRENPLVQQIYKEWLTEPYSSLAREVLHTQYHEIEKTVITQVVNW